MIFEQLFDIKSSTYTYIISSGKGREALIIDPVIENTDEYIKVLKNLDLKLVKVIDTHIHADHISGLNELSKRTKCSKIMGEKSNSEILDIRVKDNEKIKIENIELISMYTPGHTDCSYSFLMNNRVFTGAIRLGKELGPGKTIVTILCDKSDRYNSKLFNKKFLEEKNLPYPNWI
jgi:glyoxylase-like metal-dependent hydrolase (beta-lactamase superfamily II)